MRRALLGLWVCSWVGLAACGGEVRRSSTRPADGAGTSSAGKGGSSSSGSDPYGDADTELGPCVLGPVEGSAQASSCAWVVDGYCYEERAMACNCACPHDRDSQCSSGFGEGPTGHVAVNCY